MIATIKIELSEVKTRRSSCCAPTAVLPLDTVVVELTDYDAHSDRCVSALAMRAVERALAGREQR